jgi:pimeloyl-ACP methyl ester carboxylesterase
VRLLSWLLSYSVAMPFRRHALLLALAAMMPCLAARAEAPDQSRCTAALLNTPAAPRWCTLPPTPMPYPMHTALADVRGIHLFYAMAKGDATAAQRHSLAGLPPVILLHGGLANSNYWANQVRALVESGRDVIVVDSRGHGRSTRNATPYGYDVMADDVIALMDLLHLQRADIVGWSDGGIQALDLALRHPTRVRRIFAFGANVTPDGNTPNLDKNPTFGAFIARGRGEYARLSSTPTEYDAFVAQIGHMWDSEPHWTDAQLATITAPTIIADGDHDEAIFRAHTEHIAAVIPGAGLLILPNVSHFAFLQDPQLFNAAMLDFLNKP